VELTMPLIEVNVAHRRLSRRLGADWKRWSTKPLIGSG
jgi:hypothetical protein